MSNTAAQHGKLQLFALIRDRNGRPVIDGDGSKLHPEMLKLLTPEEREELSHDNFAFRRNS